VTASGGDDLSSVFAALEQGDLHAALERLSGLIAAASSPSDEYPLYLLRARLQAAIGAVDTALHDFGAALERAGIDAERGAALLGRGELAESAGLLSQATDDLSAALGVLSDPLDRASARQALARIERDHGDARRAIAMLRDVLTDLQASGADSERLAEATLDLAMTLRVTGQLAESIDLLEGLVVGAEPPLAARMLIQIGTTHGFAGSSDAALGAYERALPLLADGSERAIVRYNRAVVLRERGEFAAAGAELERALLENAGADRRVEFDALLLRGVVAREEGEVARALDFLREAAELEPDGDAQGRVRLEIGTTMAATGLYGPAITELGIAAALSVEPADRARALRHRGMARHELGLLDDALADFDAAIVLTDDPDEQAQGDATRASLFAAAGRRREALGALGRALERASDAGLVRQLRVQRAALRAEFGDLDGAADDFEHALALADSAGDDELAARVLVDYGAIHVARDEQDAAIAAFTRAARLAGSGEVAHLALLNLGNLHVSRGSAHAAAIAFEHAVAAAEDDREARAAAFLARGNANLRWGRYGTARFDLTRVVALGPSATVLDQATIALRTVDHHLAHIATTREELTKVIQAMDALEYRAQPTLQRGLLALAAGDSADALLDLTRATRLFRLQHERAVAFGHLALAHAQLGNCEDALHALADAERLAPAGEWVRALAGNPNWDACRDHPAFPAALLGRGN
jgi:tetratricopeptide (TPR) repeat protein